MSVQFILQILNPGRVLMQIFFPWTKKNYCPMPLAFFFFFALLTFHLTFQLVLCCPAGSPQAICHHFVTAFLSSKGLDGMRNSCFHVNQIHSFLRKHEIQVRDFVYYSDQLNCNSGITRERIWHKWKEQLSQTIEIFHL